MLIAPWPTRVATIDRATDAHAGCSPDSRAISAMGQLRKSGGATARSAFPSRTDIVSRACQVRKVPTTEVAYSITSSPRAKSLGADGHSGSPARRNPSSYRERSSACQGPSASLRVETRSVGLSCRSRATALCACSDRPAIALVAAAIRNPG